MNRQRGQALLFTVLLLVMGATIVVLGASSEVTRAVQADATTRLALAQAKEALVGRAVADDNRPGSLPCPDTNDDGSAELFVGNDCPSYIGRLPWRTLGLPDLRDESGERLWYALTPRFRDDNSVQINSDTAGSLTVYSVTSPSCTAAACVTSVRLNQNFLAGVPPVANTDVVAIVFAPGLAIGNQLRDTTAVACATTGTSIARNLCATNYLDTWSTVTNATAPNPGTGIGAYVVAPRTTSFNDRLAVLRTAELIPAVEKRVARELLDSVEGYFTGTQGAGVGAGNCALGCYPWANNTAGGISSVSGQNRGRLPIVAQPYAWTRDIVTAVTRANPGVVTTATNHGFATGQRIRFSSVGGMTQLNNNAFTITVVDPTHFSIGNTTANSPYTSGGIVGPVLTNPGTGIEYQLPMLPAYFERNNWDRVIYYAVARSALELGPVCTSCTLLMTSLSVDAKTGYAVVMITPGSTNANRGTGVTVAPTAYIDDVANSDANDVFVTPRDPLRPLEPVRTLDRDRLLTLADIVPPASCGPNAQALIANAPCHTTGNDVKPICSQAAANLNKAGCMALCNPVVEVGPPLKTVADKMNDPPCRNTLNPGACQGYVAQLRTCG